MHESKWFELLTNYSYVLTAQTAGFQVKLFSSERTGVYRTKQFNNRPVATNYAKRIQVIFCEGD